MEPHEQMLLIPIKVKALIAGNEKYSQTEFAGPTVNFSAVRQEENITIQTDHLPNTVSWKKVSIFTGFFRNIWCMG